MGEDSLIQVRMGNPIKHFRKIIAGTVIYQLYWQKHSTLVRLPIKTGIAIAPTSTEQFQNGNTRGARMDTTVSAAKYRLIAFPTSYRKVLGKHFQEYSIGSDVEGTFQFHSRMVEILLRRCRWKVL